MKSLLLLSLLLVACSASPDPATVEDGLQLDPRIPDGAAGVSECLFGIGVADDGFPVVLYTPDGDVLGRANSQMIVINPDAPRELLGIVIAHEVGHRLGYDHGDESPCNIMGENVGLVDVDCVALECPTAFATW